MSGVRLWRNTGVATGVYIASSVVGLVMVPFLLAGLGPAAFGVYVLALTIAGYSGFLNFGMGRGVLRAVAVRHALGDRSGVVSVVEAGSAILSALALVLFVLAIPLSAPLASVMNVPESMLGETRVLFIAAVLSYGLTTIAGAHTEALAGIHRIDLAKWLEFAQLVVSRILAVVVVALGYGLNGLAVTLVLTGMVTLAASMFASRRFSLWEKPLVFRLHRQLLKELWNYGSRTQLLFIAGTVNRSIDRLYLGMFRSAESVAAYDVGDRLAFSFTYAANPLAGPLLPVMADHMTRDDQVGARTTYCEATGTFALLAATIAVFSAVFAEPLIEAWVGASMASAAPILAVLAVGYGASVCSSAADVFARTEAVPRLATRIGLTYAGLNITASLFGVLAYGALGGAVASAAVGVLMAVAYSWIVERRLLGVSGTIAVRAAVTAAAIALPFSIAARLLFELALTWLGHGRMAQSVALLLIAAPFGLLALCAGTFSPLFPVGLRTTLKEAASHRLSRRPRLPAP